MYKRVGKHNGQVVYQDWRGQLYLEKDYRYLVEMDEKQEREFKDKRMKVEI